jgi:HNH endonuclease
MVRAYERLGTLSVQEVLEAIAKERMIEYEGVLCHTSGNRLLTYCVYGVSCCVSGCAVHGQFFAVEKAVNQKSAKFHLNLYGMSNGAEVMMTSDHKIPKSRGGSNLISNRQPMCYPHNTKKGNQLIHL